MVESNRRVFELEDEVEGDQIGTKNYRFSKIGEPVSIQSHDSDSVFDPQTPPSQPLAVSERFGLLFVSHSTGFCIVRTKDAIVSAKEEKNRPSLQELSLVDLAIGKVSILTLSADSSMLVASVGAADLIFFSVHALLNKEQKPSFCFSLDDSSGIKDIQWTKKLEESYVVLSNSGKLYYGAGQDHLKDVADNVDAVEWSVRGNLVAVARNKVLSILSSKFEEKLSISLSFKSFVGDSDSNCMIKVDSIRWVRPDCIVIGCFQLTNDGTEEGYLVQVITSQDGKITNAYSSPIVISFNDVFLGLVDDAVPFGIARHMFLSYLDQCELAFIANRKNTDQHLILFGWSLDEKKEAVMIEILNDAWLPRIDSQGNGDDNLILGLSIDKIHQDEQLKLTLGDEEKEVSPCCVLLCITVDGKLSLFHFASAVDASAPAQEAISEEEDDSPPAENGTSDSQVEEHNSSSGTEQVVLELQSQAAKETAPVVVNHIRKSQTSDNTQEQQKIPVVKLDQDGENGQQLTFSGQQVENLKQSALVTSPCLEGPTTVVKDLTKTTGAQTIAQVGSSTDTFPGKLLSEIMSNQSIQQVLTSGKVGGFTTVNDASSHSWPSGEVFSSGPAPVGSSPSSGVQTKNQSDNYHTILSNNICVPGGPLPNPPYSNDSSTKVNPCGHRASTGEGNIESLPVTHSSQIPLQEKSTLGKTGSYKFPSNKESFRASTPTGLLNSGPNPSKQLLNVEEMAKELESLLEHIEGPGGFRDASIALQKSSVVALEEGIWTDSERCKSWRGIMDEQLGKIQLILDKTVQILARKIYMEGIVKQATDSRYWDLWNRQKLSSEMELKQRHLLELNQNLTNQLIELERHFNSLEFDKFGAISGAQMNRRAFQSKHGPSRHVNSLHSLHNTMNAQLAAGEQLSECLSKQMAVLSIESPPPTTKNQNVRRELFETVGIPYDDASDSPGVKRGLETTPPSRKKILTSSSSALSKEQQSLRNKSSALKSSEPETARRRRDSLDRSWSSFNPPKTTVKRMLLQEEDHQEKVNSTSSRSSSSLSMSKQQHFDRELTGRSAAARAEQYSSSSTLSPSKGTLDAVTKQSSRSPSTSFFKFDDLSDLNHYAVDESPAQTLSSQKRTNAAPKSADKQVELSGTMIRDSEHGTARVAESLFSGKSNKSPYLPPALAYGSTSPISLSDSGNSKTQPSSFSFSFSSSMIHSSSPPPSFFSKPTAPTSSSGSLTTASCTAVNVQTAFTSSSSSSSSFQASENLVASLSVTPSSLNFASKSPSKEEVARFSLKTDNKNVEVVASSPQQPELETSSKSSEPAIQPSKPTTISEPSKLTTSEASSSTSSQSGSQQLNFSGPASPRTPNDGAIRPKPEQPSASAPFLSLSSSGNPNVAFTQEDEMEEEAPEASQTTTELALGGSLGGFGIGPAPPNPTATATKSNPFGGPFAANSTSSNALNSPFTLSAPTSGELFKPASFSFHSPQPPSRPSQRSAFNSGGFSGGTATLQTSTSRFGNPGSGQQALGSVLGSFGQSRQLGVGGPPGTTSISPPASGSFGGFVGNQSSGGGGFPNAPAGGGFASLASAGGGFSALASGGGGFSGVASGGGGFSSVGFGGAATPGGGFAAASIAGGGFAGAASGNAFSAAGGGFGGFSSQQTSGGFSSFGGGGGSGKPPPELINKMRK